MVFSIFSRKDKGDARRSRDSSTSAVDSGVGPEGVAQAAREAARRTAEKIDRIESEMIASPHAGGIRQEASPAPSATGAQPARAAPSGAAPAVLPQAVATAPAPKAAPDPMQHSTSVVLGDTSGAMAIDVNGSALPPLLEEAAILFANGQADTTVETLRHAIGEPAPAGFETFAWRMLFDLYQVTGQQPAFESLALDFAARFETAPPDWRAELVPGGDAARPAQDAGGATSLDSALADRLLATLRQQLEARDPKAALDFTGVRSADAAAGERLHGAFREFGATPPGPMVVRGVADLYASARAGIETGRRDPSEGLWMLTLLALRMLGEQQAFEDLSIDYCVTYEVSPPPWQPMPTGITVEAGSRSTSLDGPRVAAAPMEAAPGAFAFRGELKGRAPPELKSMREYAKERSDVVVDCRALARLDFVAAGELLNEVVSLRSAGKQMLFIEPNTLVYGLMLVMGIHELAEIRRRKD